MSSKVIEEIKHDGNIKGVLIPYELLLNEELSYTDKIVLSVIVSFESNDLAFFQMAMTLGENVGINPSQVSRSLSKLEKLGYVTREKKRFIVVTRIAKLFPDEVSKVKIQQRVSQNVSPDKQNVSPDKQIVSQDIQNVTHINNIYNTSNNKLNTNTAAVSETEQNNLTLNRKEETTQTKPRRENSPKVSQKGVPCPDHEDETLKVRMPIERWEKLTEHLGLECCIYQCARIEKYLSENLKKKYTDFAAVIRDFHNRATKDGHVFGWSKDGGYAYKKPWAPGFKVGGKDAD